MTWHFFLNSFKASEQYLRDTASATCDEKSIKVLTTAPVSGSKVVVVGSCTGKLAQFGTEKDQNLVLLGVWRNDEEYADIVVN